MALYSLVYVSQATQPFTNAQLQDLLDVSRKNNHARAITGMLLYDSGLFVQAIEGEQGVINALFAVIQADRRHKSVVMVSNEPIAAREFPDWRMGFNTFQPDDLEKLPGYTRFLKQTAEPRTFLTRYPTQARRLLDSFRHQSQF